MDTAPATPRDRIMLAAVELAGQDGIHRVTMSAVAARAKVSRPTLYDHFPDVAHVLQAWVDREVSPGRCPRRSLRSRKNPCGLPYDL